VPAAARPDSDPGKRALLLVGAGVLAVLVLFFITQLSRDEAPPEQPANTAATPAPATAPAELSDEVRAEAATLEDAIAAATTDEERLERQEQLAGLYIQAEAFDRAAEVQEDIAEARGTALAWADAGSLFLAHMLRTQGPDRATYAQRAAQNYERSLELDPEDLDVKTDLATAYLNDATNPMRAVEVVKEVLEENPDHVRANFNYGLMLAQINRVDQAQEQFEKVVSLTEPGDPVHQRAEQELARMQATDGTVSG
jgi:tetratricopeptide (TPR) repeat protein